MFNKNKDNKIGINDAKIGKNDTVETDNIKNNKIKKSFWNWKKRNITDKSVTHITNNYMAEKAQADSKYEWLLTIIEKKAKLIKEIHEKQEIYKECEECLVKMRSTFNEMTKKMNKQKELIILNNGVFPKEGNKYLIGNPFFAGSDYIETINNLMDYQNEYMEDYKALKPGVFVSCQKHSYLRNELDILFVKLEDYKNILDKK